MTERVKIVEINGVEYLMVEETKPQPVEFRVYYDEAGTVLFYTCEKPEGKYLVIDPLTYAEMRFDLRVIDGKLVKIIPGVTISKLKPNLDTGKCTSDEDISIIVNEDYPNKTKWKLESYELR